MRGGGEGRREGGGSQREEMEAGLKIGENSYEY